MLALLLSATLLAGPAVSADTVPSPTVWKIDVTHSELLFRVRHLVSRVTGTFTDWEGAIVADSGRWESGRVEVVVRTRSISTNNERRDNHLRSSDFFLADSIPEMTFRSTAVRMRGNAIELDGDLSIRGITHPVTFSGEYLGFVPGQQGRDRIGFAVSTVVNRLDYGLTWNRAAEGGGLVLGDEVTLEVTVAAVRQPPAASP
ncbi:MAG: YceI family protein [Gemmatimonadota bacterium]|nr:YceI family protein [Gemmatimonadota bacterium]